MNEAAIMNGVILLYGEAKHFAHATHINFNIIQGICRIVCISVRLVAQCANEILHIFHRLYLTVKLFRIRMSFAFALWPFIYHGTEIVYILPINCDHWWCRLWPTPQIARTTIVKNSLKNKNRIYSNKTKMYPNRTERDSIFVGTKTGTEISFFFVHSLFCFGRQSIC